MPARSDTKRNRSGQPSAPGDSPAWTQESLEAELHQELGRFVHEAARFDFFVGLQLNWLGPYCQVDVSKYLDPKRFTLDNRLAALKKLVKKAFRTAGPDVIAEFNEWFASARTARALRNKFAHGRWVCLGGWTSHRLGLAIHEFRSWRLLGWTGT